MENVRELSRDEAAKVSGAGEIADSFEKTSKIIGKATENFVKKTGEIAESIAEKTSKAAEGLVEGGKAFRDRFKEITKKSDKRYECHDDTCRIKPTPTI